MSPSKNMTSNQVLPDARQKYKESDLSKPQATLPSISTFYPVLRSHRFRRQHSLVSGGPWFHDKEWQFKSIKFLCFLQQSFSERVNIQERKEDTLLPKLINLRSISRWNTHLLGFPPNHADLGAQPAHGLCAHFILSEDGAHPLPHPFASLQVPLLSYNLW